MGLNAPVLDGSLGTDISRWHDLQLAIKNARAGFNPFGMHGLYMTVLDLLKQHPTRRIVLSLPSLEEVEMALTSISRPGAFWFDAAQVVNLNDMTYSQMASPPIEEWNRARAAREAAR